MTAEVLKSTIEKVPYQRCLQAALASAREGPTLLVLQSRTAAEFGIDFDNLGIFFSDGPSTFPALSLYVAKSAEAAENESILWATKHEDAVGIYFLCYQDNRVGTTERDEVTASRVSQLTGLKVYTTLSARLFGPVFT